MTNAQLPSDASSLLVPVTVDAWVVDSQNQQQVSWYYADFNNLTSLQSPIPQAFDTASANNPTVGVHLHWALPDALTHGVQSDADDQIAFPLVPNRWLVARFNVPVVGTTGAALNGNNVTTIALQAGSVESLAAGMPLQLVSPDGTISALVITSAAVAQGDQQVEIQAYNFSSTNLPLGSTVRRVRANTALPAPDGPWQCKLWVVESDYLFTADTSDGVIGTTSAALPGANITSITLQQGATVPVAVGVPLEVVTADGQYTANIVPAAAVKQGDTQITIQPATFTTDFSAGSVQLQGSAFLNPTQPTYMQVPGPIGVTASALSGNSVTSIALAAPGATAAIPAGTTLRVLNVQAPMSVVTAAAVNHGDTRIAIQAASFANDLPAGSSVLMLTAFDVKYATIGASYDIAAWEAKTDAAGQLYLQAVGPANVSFAAYAPFVLNVFNFTDNDLPSEGTGVYNYTYMVVGWYSDPRTADPLRGVSVYPQGSAAYVPPIWASEAEWSGQTAAERLRAILARMLWSIEGDVPASPPATSLYHGLVSDVQWPYGTLGNAAINEESIRVAVGNTSVDALAALIQAEAQQQAQTDPNDSQAWLNAGNNLALLTEAAMYDLLDVYGKPGGSALIEQQVQQAWYGSNPGGTVWTVVSAVPQAAGQSAVQPVLTPAQTAALDKQLAALNQNQHACDADVRQLEWLQSNLYVMWLKYAMANLQYGWEEAPVTQPPWNVLSYFIAVQFYPALFDAVWDQHCVVSTRQQTLPNPTDGAAANQWANAHWSFPAQDNQTTTLAALGLKLKAGTMPRFWHPTDPVVLIAGLDRAQKHGEDGRFNKDGTLTCRLPGQTITGVNIQTQPTINVSTLTSGGVNLAPCGAYTSVPSIPNLMAEAFLVDPGNAAVMAVAVNGQMSAIQQGIASLLAPDQCGGAATQADTNPDSWTGKAPPPFAIAQWTQAWSPLFLEWEVQYSPTGATGQFAPGDWHFDGTHYTWNGGALDANAAVGYKGRTLLTPQSPLLFKDKIEAYLRNHAKMDTKQIESLLGTVACWDMLSQSLGGLTDQFITLLPQETFPPPPRDGATVECPRPVSGGTAPSVTTLIGGQYHTMPLLQAENPAAFFPVRSGFVQFQQLQVVDAFGQTYGGPVNALPSGWPLTGQGFQPFLGRGLVPTVTPGATPGFPCGAFEQSPALIQSARLDINFLANDGSGQGINVSANPNAVCGWLLPNHLDGGISVYDAGGVLLGELWPLPPPDNWRPAPGPPGNNPPPRQPGDIQNTALRAVVSSIAAQSADTFDALLSIIDETLWMVDPLGGRKDQFLSVLIGRPLAVVQAQVQLNLLGSPIFNQTWNETAAKNPSSPPDYTWQQNDGGVTTIPFPVRLGSLELRNDGLIGYYLPNGDDYATFYAVHSSKASAGSTYFKQIVQPPANTSSLPQFQGNISLQCQGPSVTVTMILDPRGSVHAYTGILPVVSAALPAHIVEDFIRQLRVTFRTGPIMADPGTLRTPQPAEDHGVWTWIQAVAAPANWEVDQIVDADDIARLPGALPQLREGWLRLSDIDDPGA